MNRKHHEMVLEKSYSSGVEEWCCPICGRRFLVQWPPAFNMVVLEPGDQNAKHIGSTGDLHVGTLQVKQGEETALTEEWRLVPWLRWLDEVDFDNRWGKDK